ncbi:MAG TPA: xanthine dehydrogenase family protein molybdopterin-binding subunit [Pyrinomonadaceae bacterium]|jgi:xanthine dehydrogenase YagR molybdenum-binding subunit|nr:xanthine dehydrogenase family protein molybdopterin-binding subunit [Pyrinomonadaceae bacterium]
MNQALRPAIGKPVERVDGRLKVTGGARYAAEFKVANVAHGVLVMSTIANGSIRSIDTKAALSAPGVIEVLTHQNAPRVRFPQRPQTMDDYVAPVFGRSLPVLQDNTIYFNGQPIAVVVAETLEQAEHAATLVRVVYDERPPATRLESEIARAFPPQEGLMKESPTDRPADVVRGDPQALSKAEVVIDETYTIPIETHNPMELLSTIAQWTDGKLTVHDKTQWVANTQGYLALVFGIPESDVHVISPFVGGAFGSSLRPWAHPVVAAMAARAVRRPVKLVVARNQMFTSHGHRPYTVQRVALGAGRDGRLTAIVHEGTAQTSLYEENTESLVNATRILYASPNCITKYRLVRGNIQTPLYMRGPGESSGVFALDSAIDELAYKLKIDPLEMRVRNHATSDPSNGLPWSSKSLLECYRRGAEIFGWSRRKLEPRSMRDGRYLIGLGMATATYPTLRMPASARARIFNDGTAVVQSSASDMGPGTWTTMKIVGAEALAMDLSRVRSELGDSSLPKGSVHGGSGTTASVGSAVHEACLAVQAKLLALATIDQRSPLNGANAQQVTAENGRFFLKSDSSRGETYAEILRRNNMESIDVTVDSTPGDEEKKFSMHAFGAHFVEVRVDAELGSVRIMRVVSGIGAGRIMNEKTALSQITGGVVGGIGMALLEETVMDHRMGRIVNASLGEYHVPVNADIPALEAFFVEEHDDHVNPIGAKGIGEVSYVGTAAAVANAVFHATGKRIRQLPITLDKLL